MASKGHFSIPVHIYFFHFNCIFSHNIFLNCIHIYNVFVASVCHKCAIALHDQKRAPDFLVLKLHVVSLGADHQTLEEEHGLTT